MGFWWLGGRGVASMKNIPLAAISCTYLMDYKDTFWFHILND